MQVKSSVNPIIKGIWYRGSLVFFAAAICLVLWQADGKPPQALYLGITLNTALAFLTSLAKVAFLVPIVEGLGQLKWMRFLLPHGRRRALIELQVFEEGSRGGLGCLKLFCGFKGQVSLSSIAGCSVQHYEPVANQIDQTDPLRLWVP